MTDDERQIRDLVESWMSARKAGDLSGMLDLMTDDVVFMVPGREPFGKAEFVANGESVRGASLEGRAEIREIEIFGPRAIIRNRIEVVLRNPGAPPRRLSGYAMSVLRKEADGRWRLARDANLVMPH